jgi:hypothetical protein
MEENESPLPDKLNNDFLSTFQAIDCNNEESPNTRNDAVKNETSQLYSVMESDKAKNELRNQLIDTCKKSLKIRIKPPKDRNYQALCPDRTRVSSLTQTIPVTDCTAAKTFSTPMSNTQVSFSKQNTLTLRERLMAREGLETQGRPRHRVFITSHNA